MPASTRAVRRPALFALALAASACGSSPAPSPVGTPVSAATAASSLGAPSPSASNPPSSAPWTLRDAIPVDAALVVHLDGKALRGTALFSELLAELRARGVTRSLDDLDRKCGFAVEEAIDEVVVGISVEDGMDSLLVARVSQPVGPALACVAAAGNASPRASTFADRPAVRLRAELVVVAIDDLLVLGPAPVVEVAAPWIGARKRGRSSVAAALAIRPPVILSAVFHTAGRIDPFLPLEGLKGTLSVDASRVGLEIDATMPTDGAATRVRDDAARAIDSLSKAMPREGFRPADIDRIVKLASSARIRPRGENVEIRFDLPASRRGELVSSLGALAEFVFRSDVAAAKIAEAQGTVTLIAQALVTHMTLPGPNGKLPLRMPTSAPRTPASVPRGEPVELTASSFSHATWKTLGIALERSTSYSYEIVTAPDGRSATVRAFGDLDGDGTLSTIAFRVSRRGDRFEAGPVEIRDPQE